MDNTEYVFKRLKILESIVRGTMDIFAETATPSQLASLNQLGSEANRISVELDREYNENGNA